VTGRIALLALALLHGSDAAALQLRQGDLLVTDSANARVLRVDPGTGSVVPFSPRAGSGPNLLFVPAGIAIDPDGPIFVADAFADRIVVIDPTTGAQSVLHDFSAQFGDFGPSDVGDAPAGLDLEDGVSGLDRRDLFVASADGVYRVSRQTGATSSALLSGAAELQGGSDVALQEDGGEPYSLWVVANGVMARWYFEGGAAQTLTDLGARVVKGVDYAEGTALFAQSVSCGGVSSLDGLFRPEGPFGGTQVGWGGYASCLGRPLAVASPTSVFASYAQTEIVELVPTVAGYSGTPIATLPAGDVAPVTADLAVSPSTFPAPEPHGGAPFAAAFASLALLAARRAHTPSRTTTPVATG